MKNSGGTMYDGLADLYDRWNGKADYVRLADYIEACWARFGKKEQGTVLDLGCGTGSLTLEMKKRGYDMIGADRSPEMLSVARSKESGTGRPVLWLCQGMTDFDLYGTVSSVVSTMDCVNHLSGDDELRACFRRVRLFLEPGGLFLFDTRTAKSFREDFDGKDTVLEGPGALCAWQNRYVPSARRCDFYLTLFREKENGDYTREDYVQSEIAFPEAFLKRELTAAGFTLLGQYDGFSFEKPNRESRRWMWVAQCAKTAEDGGLFPGKT